MSCFGVSLSFSIVMKTVGKMGEFCPNHPPLADHTLFWQCSAASLVEAGVRETVRERERE